MATPIARPSAAIVTTPRTTGLIASGDSIAARAFPARRSGEVRAGATRAIAASRGHDLVQRRLRSRQADNDPRERRIHSGPGHAGKLAQIGLELPADVRRGNPRRLGHKDGRPAVNHPGAPARSTAPDAGPAQPAQPAGQTPPDLVTHGPRNRAEQPGKSHCAPVRTVPVPSGPGRCWNRVCTIYRDNPALQ